MHVQVLGAAPAYAPRDSQPDPVLELVEQTVDRAVVLARMVQAALILLCLNAVAGVLRSPLLGPHSTLSHAREGVRQQSPGLASSALDQSEFSSPSEKLFVQ